MQLFSLIWPIGLDLTVLAAFLMLTSLFSSFIDLYLIQNPDHFYESVAMKSSPEELQNPLAMLRHNDELLRRIGDAFVALESEVKQGRIKVGAP